MGKDWVSTRAELREAEKQDEARTRWLFEIEGLADLERETVEKRETSEKRISVLMKLLEITCAIQDTPDNPDVVLMKTERLHKFTNEIKYAHVQVLVLQASIVDLRTKLRRFRTTDPVTKAVVEGLLAARSKDERAAQLKKWCEEYRVALEAKTAAEEAAKKAAMEEMVREVNEAAAAEALARKAAGETERREGVPLLDVFSEAARFLQEEGDPRSKEELEWVCLAALAEHVDWDGPEVSDFAEHLLESSSEASEERDERVE